MDCGCCHIALVGRFAVFVWGLVVVLWWVRWRVIGLLVIVWFGLVVLLCLIMFRFAISG